MKRTAVVLCSVIATLLLWAGVASADAGTWRAYGNTNPITSSSSHWVCAGSRTVATNVVAQVCTVRSQTNTVQGAVIVRNNRSALFALDAAMELAGVDGALLGEWSCPYSGVAANSWSVCFGETFYFPWDVETQGAANGVYLGSAVN